MTPGNVLMLAAIAGIIALVGWALLRGNSARDRRMVLWMAAVAVGIFVIAGFAIARMM
jgi:hypothetical protein